ncbi:MAG: type II toxin-antitoxin system HicB family antitoxin [bacterium]|nr:type II toxin-antitoxin system HicB family antitoxin [bacterium]
MESYAFRTIIEPEKPRGYHGFVPLLRGVHTHGNTLTEIKKNLKEAIICHVQGLLKDREKIPQESETFELVQTFSERELAVSRK